MSPSSGSSKLFFNSLILNFDYFKPNTVTQEYFKCVIPLFHPTPTTQITPWLRQIVTSRKLRHKMELSIHMTSYLCIQMEVQLKTKPQHNRTWSAVTRPPRRLTSSSSILPPPSSYCAFIAARENLARVSKTLLFNGFFFNFLKIAWVWNCVSQRVFVFSLRVLTTDSLLITLDCSSIARTQRKMYV